MPEPSLTQEAMLAKHYAGQRIQDAMTMETCADRTKMLTNKGKSRHDCFLRDRSEWRIGMVSRRDVAAYLNDIATGGNDVKTNIALAR